MKKTSKIVLLVSLAIATTIIIRVHLKHALLDDAVSKIMSAEKMLYRRGGYERVISLDTSAKQRINKILLDDCKFHSWFGKSVSFGCVYFFDRRGAEALCINVYKGNVIRIGCKYIGLKDGFLDACGFSLEEAKKIALEKIHDCPDVAAEKYEDAETELSRAQDECLKCNKALDRPGGPHGH